jgi:hypothetical protein
VSLTLASIPSPSSGSIDVGPLQLHAYGVMLLLGILAATWLTAACAGRGGGATGISSSGWPCGAWAGGIVGARIYHVITSWSEVPDPKWQGVFEIWNGGLGVWGGILGGVIGRCDRRPPLGELRVPLHGRGRARPSARAGDRPLGQLLQPGALRKPTDLPWGLEIDVQNRRSSTSPSRLSTRFFSTSRSGTCSASASCLLVDRRFKIRPPGLFALYVAWYTGVPHSMRRRCGIDPSHEYFGLRLNFYVSGDRVRACHRGLHLVAAAARDVGAPLGPPLRRRGRR